MKTFINKVGAAVKAYADFRNQNATIMASANDRFEKAVVVSAKFLDAVVAGSIGVATIAAVKEAKGTLSKTSKVAAGIYLSEYLTVGIESLAVLTIEIRRDIKSRRSEAFAAKLEAEVAELRAAREAREEEMYASKMALERAIREGRAAAEARWLSIATSGGSVLDAIAEQPIDWMRPLTAEQNELYEAREATEANQD